jgi:hypothetical protein
MKLILFVISITAILPLTVFAQREHFSDQKEKTIRPSYVNDSIAREQPSSDSVIDYNNPKELRASRATYLKIIKAERNKVESGGRLKSVRSDAYLFLSQEERSLTIQK